jgi:hypothetical protein
LTVPERPLLRKADIQTGLAKSSHQRVRFTPGSGHSSIIAEKVS